MRVSGRNEDGETGEMRSSREKAFSTQMIINSESYHGVDEAPLEETAGGAARPDRDGWQSAEGPKQKMGGYQKRSNRVQNNDIDLSDDREFLGLKECRRREETENTLPLPFRQKKKSVNALLKLTEIIHRK